MPKPLVAAFLIATVLLAAAGGPASSAAEDAGSEHPAHAKPQAKPNAKAAAPAAQAAPAAPAGNAPVVVIPDSGPGSGNVGSPEDDPGNDPSFDVDDPNMGRDDGDGY